MHLFLSRLPIGFRISRRGILLSFSWSETSVRFTQGCFRAAKENNSRAIVSIFSLASPANFEQLGPIVLQCESQAMGWPTISGRKSANVELGHRRRLKFIAD